MKQTINFIAVLAILGLCSCGQQQKHLTASELEQIKDEVRQEIKAEMQADQQSSATSVQSETEATVATTEQTTESASQTSSPDASLKERAYKEGYDHGMSLHTVRLAFFTDNNEKQLKNEYMRECRVYNGLGEENYNNRALYNEYRRGFMKGYEDGNNAL